MQNCAENGYFRTLTAEDVLNEFLQVSQEDEFYDTETHSFSSDKDIFAKKPSKENLLRHVHIVSYRSSRLNSVGIIEKCRNLTICDLSCNFLQRMDSLIYCSRLVKLDVHQNQISELPKKEFWSSLSELKIVYLHNNGVSKFDELRKIQAAPNLTMLTLHDTPISIRPHYRHFLVNSIWSLKALDNVVISDEELIEDAYFSEKFKARHKNFNFVPESLNRKDDASFRNEQEAIRQDLYTVNKIQSKFCPVLIIQKQIRGFLIRMRYQYYQDTRLWAAVIIQRFYRKYKGLSYVGADLSATELPYLTLSSPRLDYETYMKYRKSTLAHPLPPTAEISREVSKLLRSNDEITFNGRAFTDDENNRPFLRLNINLNKLAASTAHIVSEELFGSKSGFLKSRTRGSDKKSAAANLKPDDIDLKSLSLASGMDLVPFDKVEEKKDKKLSGKYYTQYQFLGPVSLAGKKVKFEEEHAGALGEDVDMIPFRLSITEPPRMKGDYLEDAMIKTVELARDIRESIRVFERRRVTVPKIVAEKQSPVTTDQKLFIRTHGTMALACFRAIDQAYKDRNRAETRLKRSARVRGMKLAKEASCVMLKKNKSEAIEKMVMRNAEMKRELTTELERKQGKLMERQKTYVADRTASRVTEKQHKKERRSMVEFVCQNNAVAKALAKHQMTSNREKIVGEKAEMLEDVKIESERQKEMIRRFYDHRSLVLQSENAIRRSMLNDQLALRTAEREKEAQLRVKHLQHHQNFRYDESRLTLPTLSIASAPQRLPPLAIVSDNKRGEWEKASKKEVKRRIHDRASIWT
eukprot:gene16083-17706_t